MFYKIYLNEILVLVVILALGLSACSNATPVATIAPATAAPVVAAPATVAPAAVAPATAAPAATEGAAPAAGTNWCSGTKIVFFPGGTPGGGFEQVVYNGAVQAAADTGADVQYVWSDWDPAKMITQFTQAVSHQTGWYCRHGTSR